MTGALRKIANRFMDEAARPEVRALNRSVTAFHVCGYTGLILAMVLAASLSSYRGLSLIVMLALVAISMGMFLALVMATKILTGEEQIIYYHHEIAVMAAAGVSLWLLHEPVLPYLDLTILGIGLFLACGRIGCFMVGCCHGRPHSWGVCYRQEHADAGFTHYYVGVRLFPVQIIESLWVFFVVLVGIALVLRESPAGTALAWYIVAYDLGRFTFEFFRGDDARPYTWGFSQPQWLSAILLAGVTVAESVGILPLQLWHIVAAIALAFVMISISIKRRVQRSADFQLLHPRHVRELAEMIDQIIPPPAGVPNWRWTVSANPGPAQREIRVGCTSLGIRVSASGVLSAREPFEHFAISKTDAEMNDETARSLARTIVQLRRSGGPIEVIRGGTGVFHLLVRQTAQDV